MNPPPWSHSSLTAVDNCPKQYFHIKILKDTQDSYNDAGAAGTYQHESFEAYLKEKTPLPATYSSSVRVWPEGLKPPAGYQDYLDSIAGLPGDLYIEHRMAIDLDRKPCAFDSPNAWGRAILDVLVVNGENAVIIDHKAGKRKPSLQLKLSALFVFYHFPEVTNVDTAFVWLKFDKTDRKSYERSEMKQMWESFIPSLVRFKTAFHAEMFVPKPSGLCNGWCPVKTCEFWKPMRVKR